jgi:DNA invertase Pin-like site-specific DNA recombinase
MRDALRSPRFSQHRRRHQQGSLGLAQQLQAGLIGLVFTAALSALQPGDTLVFWKSDRWGRSAAHVLTTIGELRDRGVRVKSLTENFDLDTKEGRFMFAVLAAAAEYELELRAERQAEGIAAARRRQAEGRMLPGRKHIGRPKVTGPAEIATLRRLVADGASVTQAARTLKISRSTAYAALATTR